MGNPFLTGAGEVSCRVRAVRCPAGVPASPQRTGSAGSQMVSPPSSCPGVSRSVSANEVWRCGHALRVMTLCNFVGASGLCPIVTLAAIH